MLAGKTPQTASATERAWLEATWDADYPDAAYQLLDQFRSRRTGDLVVVGRPGYDFRAEWEIPEHRAGHGWRAGVSTGRRRSSAVAMAAVVA